MTQFKRVREGEKASASEYNKLLDVVESLEYFAKGGEDVASIGGKMYRVPSRPDWLRFQLEEDLRDGTATADALQLTWDGTGFKSTGITKTLYGEFLQGTISSGERVLAWQTAGKHFPVGGGGSGSGPTVISFTITDIYRGIGLLCNAVEATVLEVSCGATDVDVGDEVIIWDALTCTFSMPMELLIGIKGYATRMTTPDPIGDGGPEPETPCRWVVTFLCCADETV